MRDHQRQCAYDAENILQAFYDRGQETSPVVEIGGSAFTLPPEAKFGSIESLQAYCDQVTDMMSLRPVRVHTTRGDSCAYYCRDEIVIPVGPSGKWAMREIVALHELAHHMAGTGQGHGPRFVASFIELLSRTMGPEVGMVLRLINSQGDVKEGV